MAVRCGPWRRTVQVAHDAAGLAGSVAEGASGEPMNDIHGNAIILSSDSPCSICGEPGYNSAVSGIERVVRPEHDVDGEQYPGWASEVEEPE